MTWLGLGTFFDRRDSIQGLRFSIDDCSLDERVVFSTDPDAEPTAERRHDPRDLTLERSFVTLPKATTRSQGSLLAPSGQPDVGRGG